MNEKNEINLTGSIDLMRLVNVGTKIFPTRDGGEKRCIVIPIEENDIYITKDEMTGKTKAAYYGVNINQRREVSQHGATHYAKPSVSNKFAERFPELAEQRKNTYIGDFKPFVFEGGSAVNSVAAEFVQREEDDDLPF